MDIAEILKDCPKGTKLYSLIYGELILEFIQSSGTIYPICCRTSRGNIVSFTKDGKLHMSNLHSFHQKTNVIGVSLEYQTNINLSLLIRCQCVMAIQIYGIATFLIAQMKMVNIIVLTVNVGSSAYPTRATNIFQEQQTNQNNNGKRKI